MGQSTSPVMPNYAIYLNQHWHGSKLHCVGVSLEFSKIRNQFQIYCLGCIIYCTQDGPTSAFVFSHATGIGINTYLQTFMVSRG